MISISTPEKSLVIVYLRLYSRELKMNMQEKGDIFDVVFLCITVCSLFVLFYADLKDCILIATT